MRLTHGPQHDLVGLGVVLHSHRGVLGREPTQRSGQLVLLVAPGGGDSHRKPRIRPLPRFDEQSVGRLAARAACSIRQPSPTCFSPPMTKSRGMKTSFPSVGPFWKNVMAGRWRRPVVTPGKFVGISATVMPRCEAAAQQPSQNSQSQFRPVGQTGSRWAMLPPLPSISTGTHRTVPIRAV